MCRRVKMNEPRPPNVNLRSDAMYQGGPPLRLRLRLRNGPHGAPLAKPRVTEERAGIWLLTCAPPVPCWCARAFGALQSPRTMVRRGRQSRLSERAAP